MKHLVVSVLAIALGCFISYRLALAGAPQQQWLWCQILKQCPVSK